MPFLGGEKKKITSLPLHLPYPVARHQLQAKKHFLAIKQVKTIITEGAIVSVVQNTSSYPATILQAQFCTLVPPPDLRGCQGEIIRVPNPNPSWIYPCPSSVQKNVFLVRNGEIENSDLKGKTQSGREERWQTPPFGFQSRRTGDASSPETCRKIIEAICGGRQKILVTCPKDSLFS